MKILILLFIALSCSSVWAQNYYRSAATGNWNVLATWQQSADNVTWVAATVLPGAANARDITIQVGHTVSVTALLTVTPQLGGVITVNGTLSLTTQNLTISNGTAATDFINNGTVNVGAGRTLTLNAQAINAATGVINITSILTMGATATLQNDGTVTNNGTFTVNAASASVTNNNNFTNNGTINYTAASSFSNAGTLTNNNILNISTTGFANTGTGVLNNQQAAPGSTVNYNATVTQNVIETDYYDINLTAAAANSSFRNLTLTSNIIVRNNMTVGLGNAGTFNINGAGNSIIINGNLTLSRGILNPADGVAFIGNGLTNSIIGSGGTFMVNILGSNVLLSQYNDFETWGLAAANIVQYNGAGSQDVDELLPDGSAYGSIAILAGGTKTLNLTGAMPNIQGNFSILDNATFSLTGTGTLGISGNLSANQLSTINTVSTVSFSGIGGTNTIDLRAANANIRTINVTAPSLLTQFSGFETWMTLFGPNASAIINFNSTTALTIEAIPGSGNFAAPGTNAYREINISGNRGSNIITFAPEVIRAQKVFTVAGTYGSVVMTNNTMWFENTSGALTLPNIPYNQVDASATILLGVGDYTMNTLNLYNGGGLSYQSLGNSLTVANDLNVDGAGNKIVLNNTYGSSFIVNGTTTCSGTGVQRLFTNSTPTIINHVYIYGDIVNTYGVASTDTLILNNAGVFLNLLGSSARILSGPAKYYTKDNVKVNNLSGWTFNSDVFMVWTVARDFQVLQPLTIGAGKNLDSYGATPAAAFSHNLHNPTLITVGNFATQVKNWNQLTTTIQYVSNTGNNVNDGLTPANAKRNLQNAHAVLAAGGRLIILNNVTDTLYVSKQIIIEGQGKTTTTLSPIAKALNCTDYLKARYNGIITFGTGSDSSTIKNLKIAHSNQENRTAIMVMPRVKNIVIDNIWVETSGSGYYKGNSNYPYDITAAIPSFCGSDADNTNFGRYICQVAAQYYSSFRLKNSDLTVAAITNPLHRAVAGYVVGTNVDSVIIENNTINNSSQAASQCVWVQEVTNVHIRNNTIQGSNFSIASDVFGVDVSSLNNRFVNPRVYVKSNTISTTATHQICFKLCSQPTTGHVFAQNNLITTHNAGTRMNMGVGIGVESTLNATVEGNVFNAPATGNFIHVFVDNYYSTTPLLSTTPSINIWGNTFNANATVNPNSRAVVFRKTDLDPLKPYKSINFIGSTSNIFSQNVLRYVDIERGLFNPLLGIVTIDMSSQNSFPAIETGYTIEDKITHYLDSRRNESDARPLVNFHNKHFYVTAQQSAVPGEVINTSFPICNRSIQDALDLVPTTSNDYWIHVDAKTFKSGSEMAGAELEYGASTQIENTINIITPIYFVGRDTFNTRINRHINVNLANPNQQVTQFGCFTFGVDGIGGVKNFTVTQGDWDLNTKVIIFAPVNALLSETVGNTIKDNYAKTVPGGIRGYIQTTRNLNAPSNLNVAGFGAVITSAVNMGITVIRRGHNEQILPSPQISIFRYFDIHPTTNAGLNATLVFRYDSSERNNRVEANLKQWRNNDPVLISSWAQQMPVANWSLKGGTAGVSSVSFSGIPSFSRWTLAEGEVVLPVSELVFNAQLIDQKVKLNWSTKNEQNLAHFEIERSFDLQNFEYLSTKIANGNNGASAQYQDWDNQPKKGVSYYRLKLVNVDGSFTYSNIETIVWEDPGFISIYPNPANQQFNIALGNMDENSVLVQLIDIQGKIITNQSFVVNNGLVNIPTDKLSQGMYVVKVTTQKSVLTGRVVINK